MIDVYLQIFYQVCIQLVGMVVPAFGVWLLLWLFSSLLFKE